MPVQRRTIPILVVAGQSNAALTSVVTGTAQVADQNNAIIVHCAVGGSPLDAGLDRGTGDWSASSATDAGEMLTQLMSQIAAFVDPMSETYLPGAYLAGVVWLQGEADAWRGSSAASYAQNLIALDNRLTAEFGSHRFVVSQLADSAGSLAGDSADRVANWHTIQDQQAAFAATSPSRSLINPDQLAASQGLPTTAMFGSDGLHYAPAFGTMLGSALAGNVFSAAQTAARTAPAQISHSMGNDEDNTFTLRDEGRFQVLGQFGNDVVRLSSLSFAVSLIGVDNRALVAETRSTEHDFRLDLVSVERMFLTAHADRVALGARTVNLSLGAGDDIMSGSTQSDTLWLDAGSDQFSGRSGNDSAYGGDGNDLMNGDFGDDRLYGGANEDTVLGGDGNDLVAGGDGADRLYGGAGNDTIISNTGNDILFSSTGSDVFVFAVGDGNDQIKDFNPFRADRLDFSAVTGFTTAQDVIGPGGAARQSGTDVVIIIETNASVLLKNVLLASLDASDFIF